MATQSTTVIRQVTDAITTISVPFARFGLIKFGGRATLAKMASGKIVVVSPTSLTDEVRTTIDNLGGQLSYIIAPDFEHHLNIGPWKTAFPNAQVFGPEGLYEKRVKAKREDVKFDYVFTATNKHTLELPADFKEEFDIEYFDGHTSKELAIFHKPSRTLIEADIVFNLPSVEAFSKTGSDARSGFFTKLATRAFASTNGKAQQRFIWYVMSKDKPSFNKSAKVVADWNFDRIIPCHGEVIETGGKDIWRRLFAWHIAAVDNKKSN